MHLVNITSAKAHLSTLINEVEEKNGEIIIERFGKPVAKIIKFNPVSKGASRLGAFRKKIKLSDDYDRWPDDIASKMGLID